MPSAYLLVSHGSRDLRSVAAMEQLVTLCASRAQMVGAGVANRRRLPGWQGNRLFVGKACLELSPTSLAAQIIEFSDRAWIQGYDTVEVVPIFLLAGTHVMEDIPAQVAIARQTLGAKIEINLRSHLGSHPKMVNLLAQSMTDNNIDAWILLAHGSRRAAAKDAVTAIADKLGAIDAYWAVTPRLELRVSELMRAGNQRIGILPYFLFAGGITDAIAQQVKQLRLQFPDIELHLAEPLGASTELADLIWDLVEK